MRQGDKKVWVTTRSDVAHRIRDVFGAQGAEWLAGVNKLVGEVRAEWRLVLGSQILGNYSFVIPAGNTILKVFPPGEEFDRHLDALLAWQGDGAVRAERYDRDRGALLMERAVPGIELTQLFHEGRDREATEIACATMRRLAVPIEGSWPTARERADNLKELRRRYIGGTGPLPEPLVQTAESLFAELLDSQGEQVLIHADLHHENILESQRGWLAIDPHGLIAEPEFETYALLLNPEGIARHTDVKAITTRRLDQMADLLGFDRERIRSWGIACAVLSAWWSLDGHGEGYEDALAMADVLRSC
jgi:streptomycin 6-kinase